ncbi:acyltransferase family protein [Lapillicoccus jejuensis]|uniref:Peptidoglycan/LPS O-acetylase OafA/YrhL n=1 Tax=Lapillicoccus jejuensis TaxID=402171 RepID=A0A542DW00_9MICO|nr:acyltransferase family protein [Lapillicoccus jejuensis]TQJ07253.1 peptidoglycan/LPS O-acetylase OafA/YrhL [Lapillicoccus jejuensis]
MSTTTATTAGSATKPAALHGPLSIAQAFDPRRNSIGFLRWFLAFAVIFSHAGPIAGFYGSKNLGVQWSDEQSFGGVAVSGFFFLSGFLISRSRQGRSTVFRYFWRRILRIFPAFWAALLLTAFVWAPLAWWHVHHTLRGYFSAQTESPLTYFWNNMFLELGQRNLAGMGNEVPLAVCCGRDWNGSAWTLAYEFKGYILIGVLGLIGFLAHRWIIATLFALMIALNTVTFLNIPVKAAVLQPLLNDFFLVMLLTPFVTGMLFSAFADKIVVDDRVAVGAAAIAFYTYFVASGWNVYGQFAFLYVLMWCAIRLPLRNWERYGDMSYGIYIYAWPIMYLATFFHLETRGWLAYHLGVVVACHITAWLSWHLLEKRALALKNWTPAWMALGLQRLSPVTQRARATLVDPRFSSTPYAARLRHEATLAGGDLVSHDPASRVAHAGTTPGTATPPPATRARTIGRWTALSGLAVVLLLAALVLPRVYDARYSPAARGVAPAAAAGASPSSSLAAATTPVTATTGDGADLAGLPAAAAHAAPDPATVAAWQQHQAQSQAVVQGKDGMSFLGEAYLHNVTQALGLRSYSPAEVQRAAASLDAQSTWLTRHGIASQFVVAPAKWEVYPEDLPDWASPRGASILDQLVGYRPSALVDLRPELVAAKASGKPFSLKNSHWSDYGAYVAWAAMARHLTAAYPTLGPVAVPTLSGTTTQDLDNEFTAIDGDKGPNDWQVPQYATPLRTPRLVGADGRATPLAAGTRIDVANAPMHLVTPSAPNRKRLLVLGDSTVTAVAPLLTNAFADVTIVRHYLDQPDKQPSLAALVARYHPQVVLTLTTQRNLDVPLGQDLGALQAGLQWDRTTATGEARWTAGGAAPTGGLAVDGSADGRGTRTVTLPSGPASAGGVAALDLTASAGGSVRLTGTTASGPWSTTVRVAPGTTSTWALLAAGLEGGRVTLSAGSGSGADQTLTALTVRPRAAS